MAYSLEDEIEAQRRLGEIWNSVDRRERLKIASKLGYTKGRENNRLRSARRLFAKKITKGTFENITPYFNDYIADEKYAELPRNLTPIPNAFKGVLPNITIEGKAQIISKIMYVSLTDGDIYTTFESNWNTTDEGGFVDKSSLRSLIESYSNSVEGLLGRYKRGKFGETVDIVAIAFSQDGVDKLVSADWSNPIRDPKPDTPYGIALSSTTVVYKKEEGRKIMQGRMTASQTQRRIPRQRRQEIISYINRSYAQRKRRGSIVS
tara:strand:- start:949 stop:1737 length:789 start_codon:yes stop_codon:yes gene_type:complete